MKSMSVFERRSFLAGTAAIVFSHAIWPVHARQVVKDIMDLQPGEYTWHPDRQPDGPVAIVVSIPEQRVHVYRNGVRIAVSTCSTGKPGHSTPTGVFVVLQKDKDHRSKTYNNAPMPNMNRLTWKGIALHAGNLPGYPASHGCIRLPLEFSEKLFTLTHVGTPVIISGAKSDPWELVHPGMVLSAYAENEFEQIEGTLEGKKHPADWVAAEEYPVTTVIASSADQVIELIENGRVVAKGPLTLGTNAQIGGHVYVLRGSHSGAGGMQWIGFSHGQDGGVPGNADVLYQLKAEQAFLSQMQARMHPGMILVTTDLPLEPDRRSGADFVIATTDHEQG